MIYVIAGFWILISLLWFRFGSKGFNQYKYDETNPYRRRCKKCDSYQVMYSNPENTRNWWEEHDEGNDPKCSCHRNAIINTY